MPAADKLPRRDPLLERVLRAASPAWAASRQAARLREERARIALDAFHELRERRGRRRDPAGSSEVRKFDAASRTARTQGWMAPLTAPDATSSTFLAELVKRSRDLSRNNKWAAKAKRAISTHMVGDGVRVVVEHERDADRLLAQELFDQWAEEDADADGRMSLYGLQRLAAAEVAEAGECLARLRLRRQSDGLAVPLQVQILESEFLDSTQDSVLGLPDEGGRLRRLGVEFDQRGRRVGYWVWSQHPGVAGWTLESRFIPADSLLHVYRVDRAGQVRGVPWGAPCLLDLRDLNDWADATMVRTKLAACFAGFITTEFEDSGGAISATGKATEELEPGTVQKLQPGEQITLASPPGVEGMEDFPKLTLHGIGVGYGVPYHVLAGDLSQVNFSSARIGNLDWERELAGWRTDWLVPQLVRGVWRAWRSQAELAGLIAPGCRMSWTPPSRGMIEPKIEAEAAVARIRGGLSTLSEEQRASGWRPEDLMAEQASDWERARALGITLDSDPSRAAQGQASAAPAAPPA